MHKWSERKPNIHPFKMQWNLHTNRSEIHQDALKPFLNDVYTPFPPFILILLCNYISPVSVSVVQAIKKIVQKYNSVTLQIYAKLPVLIPGFEAVMWFGTRPQSCFICPKVPRAGGRGFCELGGADLSKTSSPPSHIRIDAVQLNSLTLPWKFRQKLRSVPECLWISRIVRLDS